MEKEYGRKEAARQKKGRRICVDSFTDSKHNNLFKFLLTFHD
jgi:hypothetical protein